MTTHQHSDWPFLIITLDNSGNHFTWHDIAGINSMTQMIAGNDRADIRIE
jgi:hypothetical protein